MLVEAKQRFSKEIARAKEFFADEESFVELEPIAKASSTAFIAFGLAYAINYADMFPINANLAAAQIAANNKNVPALIDVLPSSDPEIIQTSLSNLDAEYAQEQNPFFTTQAQDAYPTGKRMPPNYEIIGVGELQRLGWTGEGVRVYILDTGISPEIAQIYGISKGYDAIADLACDAGENTMENCDDLYGKTHHPHGGGVAAITKSIAPEAEVIPVRMINGDGESSKEWLENAIDYIVEDSRNYDGATIINASFGSSEFIPEDFSKLNHPNFIVITALGNIPNGVRLPATLPYTAFDTGSVDVNCGQDGELEIYRHWSSEISPEVEGMAPGGGNCLFIATPNGGPPLRDKDGNLIVVKATSGAAPHVAGLAADFVGAGEQAGYTVTRDEIREFFTNMLSRQLIPGEEYNDPAWLTRNGYYGLEDVLGTPSEVTGYGLVNAAQAARNWLRYLEEGGELGEISFTVMPNTDSADGGAGMDEWMMARVNMRSGLTNNSIPKLFKLRQKFSIGWIKGPSMLNFQIDGHTNSIGARPVVLGSEPVSETVRIDPFQLPRTVLPTPPTK